MPTLKQTPASIRYFKARLNILKRPMVWTTASGLILSVFLVGEYLANPQRYTSGNDPNATTNLPNQNPSNNLPTQDMSASSGEPFETLPDLSNVLTQTSSDAQSFKNDKARSPILQEFLLGRSSDAAHKERQKPSQYSLPLTSSSESQSDRPSESRLPSLYPLGSLMGLPSSTFSSAAISYRGASFSNNSIIINPLQSALDQYPSINKSPSKFSSARSPTQSSAEHRVRDSRPSATEDLVRQDFWEQQESSSQGLPSPQFTPQLSPFPGTTGYTLPPALRTSTSSVSPFSSNGSFQPIPGQITSQTVLAAPGQAYSYGQPSHSGARQTTAHPSVQPSLAPSSQPVSIPFSVPHTVPGRSIGGGQINTFSNP